MKRAPLAVAMTLGLMTLTPSPAAADKGDKAAERAAVQRGAGIAARVCSACHATGRSGVSPKPEAPTFSDIGARYARTHLDWELEAIAEVGHYRMPPLPMSKEDIHDLDAYVRSLTR